eukprot:2923960-Pyramimonas_sp.AAC.1
MLRLEPQGPRWGKPFSRTLDRRTSSKNMRPSAGQKTHTHTLTTYQTTPTRPEDPNFELGGG